MGTDRIVGRVPHVGKQLRSRMGVDAEGKRVEMQAKNGGKESEGKYSKIVKL